MNKTQPPTAENSISDRRRFTRLPFRSRVRLSQPNSDQGQEVTLLDLSLHGALIEIPPNQVIPHCGEKRKLELFLDEIETVISMETQVAHIRGRNIGLICKVVDLDSITHLRRLVELNLGDAELLQRELAFLAVPSPSNNRQ